MNNFHEEFKDRLNMIVNTYSSKTAVTYMRNDSSTDKMTFNDIWNFIQGAAEIFKNIGLKQGDRTAIISAHSPYAAFTGMALAYYGTP